MADAIARASEDEPDLLIDVATLTGAAIVALGDRTAALMATDDETADRILDAAESAGEDLWQLPIPARSGPGWSPRSPTFDPPRRRRWRGPRSPRHSSASSSVHDIAWAHLDIAGPAYNDKGAYGHISGGGTGYGVRTLVALATGLQG